MMSLSSATCRYPVNFAYSSSKYSLQAGTGKLNAHVCFVLNRQCGFYPRVTKRSRRRRWSQIVESAVVCNLTVCNSLTSIERHSLFGLHSHAPACLCQKKEKKKKKKWCATLKTFCACSSASAMPSTQQMTSDRYFLCGSDLPVLLRNGQTAKPETYEGVLTPVRFFSHKYPSFAVGFL